MKTYLLSFLMLALSLIFVTSCSSVSPKNDTSQLKYNYAKLKIMDLDEMTRLMYQKSEEYKRTDNIEALKEGLLVCLSRPDEDTVVEKIISIVRTPLEDQNQWEPAVEELINTSIAKIKDKNESSADQVTYSVVLENLISELKPEFTKQYKSPGFETRMIEKIAAAEIELSSHAKAERKLNLMKGSFTASAVAQKLIDKKNDYLKKEEEKKKAQDKGEELEIDSPR